MLSDANVCSKIYIESHELPIALLNHFFVPDIRDGVMSNRELQYEFSKLAALCNKKQDLLANDSKSNPTIYCITPTYARPVQEAELTRLV